MKNLFDKIKSAIAAVLVVLFLTATVSACNGPKKEEGNTDDVEEQVTSEKDKKAEGDEHPEGEEHPTDSTDSEHPEGEEHPTDSTKTDSTSS